MLRLVKIGLLFLLAAPCQHEKFLAIALAQINVNSPYLIPLRRFTGEVRDDLDQWVYAFKNNEVLDEFTAPGIGALKEKLDYLKMDGEERRRFEAHLDYVRSERGTIEDAHEEGLEEGLEKGLVKGREEGREEERKTLIKSLYDNGVAIEVIAASVGLSVPAIRRVLDDEFGNA